MTRITITLDALHDLSEAGEDTDLAEQYGEAFTRAAGLIAAAAGISVEIVCCPTGSCDDRETETDIGRDDSLETLVWQRAHDACRLDTPGGYWTDASAAIRSGKRLGALLERQQ